MISGRNLKGQHGRVKVETVNRKGDRLIELDGMRFQVGQSAAEDLMAALNSSLRPYAGYAIVDRVQQNLDPVLDRLVSGDVAEDGRDPGRAEAYTMVLAIIRNPYEPDYPGEKERQMEHYNKGAE